MQSKCSEQTPLAASVSPSPSSDILTDNIMPPSSTSELRGIISATVCMMAISHCQYTWTLFVASYQAALGGVSEAEVQFGFSAFVTLQTTSVLCLGLLVPVAQHRRLIMLCGAAALLVSLLGLSAASGRVSLYSMAALMGVGVGSLYSVCVSVSVSSVRYRQHRGLTAGVVAAGYGAGTLPTIALIEHAIVSAGYETTLRGLAWAVSLVSALAALAMPPHSDDASNDFAHLGEHLGEHLGVEEEGGSGSTASRRVVASSRNLRLTDVVRRPSYWILYLALTLISFVGLVVVSQLKPIAQSYSLSPATVVAALQLDRILNGASRPLWGWLSDCTGRETALGLAFSLQALILLLWSTMLGTPFAFVAFSGLSTFAWGEIYSLFPSIAADWYGPLHVAETYGCLYTGKAVASFLAGPAASALATTFSWEAVVVTMAAASAVDAYLIFVLLKWQRAREVREQNHIR